MLGAQTAAAGIFYQVSATTSDGAPLNAVTPGSKLILDITATTDDFLLGVVGSVHNYDNTIVSDNPG